MLPAYQAGLLVALGLMAFTDWRRLLSAFGVLLASQIVFLVALGELAAHAGLAAHPLFVRAWAVGVPVVLTAVMLRAGPPAARTLASLRPAADGPR